MNIIAQRLAKKFRLLKLALLSDDLKVYPDLKKYFRTREKAEKERYDENGVYHQDLDWWYTLTNETEKFYVYKMYGMGINRPLYGYAELFQMTKNTQDKDTICFVSICSDDGIISNVIGHKIYPGMSAQDVIDEIANRGITLDNGTFLLGGKIPYRNFENFTKFIQNNIIERNKNIKKSYLHRL